jgi:hypothetical protein
MHPTANKDRQRFIKLGWQLIEHKFRYYILAKPTIPDAEFDSLEAKYRSLAEQLGEEPSASDMVDFDWNRPSCMNVALKVLGAKADEFDLVPHTDGSLYKRSLEGVKKVTRKGDR